MLGFVRQTQVIKFTGTLGRQHSRYLWKPLFFQKKNVVFFKKLVNHLTGIRCFQLFYQFTEARGKEGERKADNV